MYELQIDTTTPGEILCLKFTTERDARLAARLVTVISSTEDMPYSIAIDDRLIWTFADGFMSC